MYACVTGGMSLSKRLNMKASSSAVRAYGNFDGETLSRNAFGNSTNFNDKFRLKTLIFQETALHVYVGIINDTP